MLSAHSPSCPHPLIAALAVAAFLAVPLPIARAHGGTVAPPTNPRLATATVEDALLANARSAIDDGRFPEAERTLRTLIDKGGLTATTDKTARLMLGGLLLDSLRTDDALDVLMPLDEVDEYDAQHLLGRAFTERGHALAANGAYAEDVMFHHELALVSLERAIDLAPTDEVDAAIGALELTLYTLGDAEAALRIADRALDRSPSAGEVLLLRGCAGGYAYWDASSSGDDGRADILWQRAVDDLRSAQAELDMARVEPWVQLAWLGLQKDDGLEQALDDAREAAERGAIAPLFDVAVVGAARGDPGAGAAALYALEKHDAAALTGFLAARTDAASLAERFSYLIFESNGTYDRARDVHAALAAATRESSMIWNNYALLCRDTGKYQEAYRAYGIALEINGPEPRLINDTALVLHYHLMGDDPEKAATACAMYRQAIELAEAELASEGLDADARAELNSALTDARDNLRRLEAGELASTRQSTG
jgi:tetratricopeptide (TPR) repeat protein